MLMIEILCSIYFERKIVGLGFIWSVSGPSASSSITRTSFKRVSQNLQLGRGKYNQYFMEKLVVRIHCLILCCSDSKQPYYSCLFLVLKLDWVLLDYIWIMKLHLISVFSHWAQLQQYCLSIRCSFYLDMRSTDDTIQVL